MAMKLLSVASEIYPLVKTGGLADVAGALLGALAVQVQDLINLVVDLRRGNATARLALLLVSMAQGVASDASLPVTQQELAELLGVTRPTANGALRELEAMGLVERGYGRLRVRDRQARAKFARD